DDVSTGINQVSYTAEFGNGVSASISLEDQSGYRWAQGPSSSTITVLNVTPGLGSAANWLSGFASGATNYTAGTSIPDIV
ncbi:porin, partial [Streptococcus pyogenes]